MDVLALLILKSNHSHKWLDGVCSVCGYQHVHLEFVKYNTINHKCKVCGMQMPHTFSNYSSTSHKCSVCEQIVAHTWTSTAQNHTCSTCSASYSHTYDSNTGKCSICSYGCLHPSGFTWATYLSHKCSVCGYMQNHSWERTETTHYCPGCMSESANHNYTSGYCNKCGYYCQHTGANMISNGDTYHMCVRCGKTTIPHTFVKDDDETHTCSACSASYSHKYSDGYCSMCDWSCSHSKGHTISGKCNICNKTVSHNYVIPQGTSYVCRECSCGSNYMHTYNTVSATQIKCSYCNKTGCGAITAHTFNSSGRCSVCGYLCNHGTNYSSPDSAITYLNSTYHKCSTCNRSMSHSSSGYLCVCGAKKYNLILSGAGISGANGYYYNRSNTYNGTFSKTDYAPVTAKGYYAYHFKETNPNHYGTDFKYTFNFWIITTASSYSISTLNPTELLANTPGQYKNIISFSQYNSDGSLVSSTSNQTFAGSGMGAVPSIMEYSTTWTNSL